MRKRGKNFKGQFIWAAFSFAAALELSATGEAARYCIVIPQVMSQDIINYGNWQEIKYDKNNEPYIIDWSRYKAKTRKTPRKLYFSNFERIWSKH